MAKGEEAYENSIKHRLCKTISFLIFADLILLLGSLGVAINPILDDLQDRVQAEQ